MVFWPISNPNHRLGDHQSISGPYPPNPGWPAWTAEYAPIFGPMVSLPTKVPAVWKAVMWAGVLVLLHAAGHGALQVLEEARCTADVTVPVDIYVEVAAGFSCRWGIKVGGEFRPAIAAASATAVGMGMNSDAPSFHIFNHRGRQLHKDDGHVNAHVDGGCQGIAKLCNAC